MFVTELECVKCHSVLKPDATTARRHVWMTCPACGPEEGILDFRYDLDAVKASWHASPLETRPWNHWRYHELLPLAADQIPWDWQVGWTPVINARRLAKELGVRQILLKDEGRNPSASFKDRASSVGVAHAMQVGATTIACASTGNAASSLACHAARANLAARIFVPRSVPAPKLAQLLAYGATVLTVDGSYDDAYQLCSTACDQFGWYNRNCAVNPVLVEGKKTGGLEIAEQSGVWGAMPDWVTVSIGDGCTIAGVWKGLVEMHALGRIERLPRLLGVQAAKVAPIAYAFKHDALPKPNGDTTVADSIDVQVPRNWRKAVRALADSEGVVVCVSDQQILDAIRIAGREGVFAEPAAAAAIAGVVEAVNTKIIGPHDRVLALMTGSGLKDTRTALLAEGSPLQIPPELDAVAEALKEH